MPGATIAYGHPAEHGAPSAPLQPVGGADETRNLVVAPAPPPPPSASAAAAAPGASPPTAARVDVVEAVALDSGAEIRTDTKHGFGASAGPVKDDGEKVTAHAAEEGGGGEGGEGPAAPPTKT